MINYNAIFIDFKLTTFESWLNNQHFCILIPSDTFLKYEHGTTVIVMVVFVNVWE